MVAKAKRRSASDSVEVSGAPQPKEPGTKPSSGGDGGAAEKEGKEGHMLLGLPTFVDAGAGRWRCSETGHEMPERERESYARSRACRLALIDAAVARKKPPLNVFRAHPESKSKLVCTITGDVINKTEEHIWKHINGRRFMNKLEFLEIQEMEPGAGVPESDGQQKNASKAGKKSTKSSNENPKKKKKAKDVAIDTSLPRERKPEIDDSDDPEFWMPPVGSRWDNDTGKDRWDSLSHGDGQETDDAKIDSTDDKNDVETSELSSSTKRMSIAIGPSSFASRKKKAKKSAGQ